MSISSERLDTATETVHRRTAEALGRGPDFAEGCEAVCRSTVAIIEAEFETQKAAGAAIACAAGCAFCCHLRVGAYPHEAIALLRWLRTAAAREVAAAIEERILANARAIDGMSVAEHRAANLRCAFLVDGRCSAYAVRPSACARYHSLSRSRCEHSYEHPRDIGTPRNSRPALLELQAFGAAVASATEAALERAGVATTRSELHQLLRTLLEDPTAIERWRAGEEIASE